MHQSSLDKMLDFRNKYLRVREEEPLVILDLGSSDIGGTYRVFFDSPTWKYIGVDVEPQEGVDIVLSDPYNWHEIKSSSIDVLISGQTFEHIEYFWLTMSEIARVLKPGGICCIIASSSGPEHKYPVDCWRFYPDGLKALARYTHLDVLEAKTQWEDDGCDEGSAQWKDSVLVCKKPLDFSDNAAIKHVKVQPPVPSVEPMNGNSYKDFAFNPLHFSKVLLGDPRFLSDMTFWHQHIPFAFALVQMLEPRMFVELGTHKGDSYLAFCQAIDILGLNAKCYAVDTWAGDQHTGSYDISIYESLKAYHDPLYGRFSTFIRSTFDEAVEHFSDCSIDLLHIDGTHSFEAVKHDYETWLPKMSERGIMLFHDINVRERDFGVWKLWEELKVKHPSFEFMHGFGLGILGIGKKIPKALEEFFGATGQTAATLSGYFQLMGSRVSLLFTANRQGMQLADRNRHIEEIDNALKGKEAHTKKLESVVGEKDRRIGELELALKGKEAHTKKLESVVGEKDRCIGELELALKGKEAHIKELARVVGERDRHLDLIHSSHGWRILTRYYRLRDRLLPANSRRRLLMKLLFRTLLMSPKEVWGHVNRANLNKLLYYFRVSEPEDLGKRIERKLNEHVQITESNNSLNDGTNPEIANVRMPHDSYESNNHYHNYLSHSKNTDNPEYVPLSSHSLSQGDFRLIAFYLPQFHPIPENDKWWGTGFTEWTNVSKAVPQFKGHYQPRLPGELGFYDLRLPEIMKRQIELAKMYGIYGFCFHFYWFDGKTLLERPLQILLDDAEMNIPFCINWANENWTRRWDGMDNDVLIGQAHSPEDDIEFIKYVSKYLKDPRYIRVDSKPLLMVYRPALLPDAKKTAQRWRTWCRENGIGEIYLTLSHSFEHIDPRDIGFDAAIEFAPNTFPLRDITSQFELINPDYKGQIFDYESAIEIAKKFHVPLYKKFRSICPGWDNDARKQGKGVTLANATPEAYQRWLKTLFKYTQDNFERDERMIFINAWNEWAEGAYLEPDRKYGYAYLDKTAEVLTSFSKGYLADVPGKWSVLFVSHDACRAGAQSVLLNIIDWFKKYTSLDLKILCLDGGEWLPRFRELGDTLVLSELKKKGFSYEELVRCLREFCGGTPDLVYGNSVVSGREYELFKSFGAPIITHFHELETSIKRYAADWIDDVLKYSSHFIACSGAVRETLVKNYGIDESKISTVHASINPDGAGRVSDDKRKRTLRKKLRIEIDKFLVFGCGLGMPFRKGADLFIETARTLVERGIDNFHFYWIGDFDLGERNERLGKWSKHLKTLKKSGLGKHVTFLGLKDNPREYLRAGDVFLLPSREDPFPLVALEAAECGLPIICFADAGGMPDFVSEDAGFVVSQGNVESMAEKVALLMKNNVLKQKLGGQAREKLLTRFTFQQTTPYTLSACRGVAGKKPAVSIIVPNYNHARYLPKRLDSIFDQTFRDFEVILLDDASTDSSLDVLEKYAHRADVRIVRNERNTGSPCSQWLKGINMARADIIWIAESDDVCEPQFLETLLPAFCNPEVKLAYVDSHVIDESDRVTGDYINCEYLTSLSRTKWKKSYTVSATEEMNDGLGVKNTILNISAVLLRKPEIDDKFRRILEDMRIAGDWYFIANAIRDGKIHYEAKKLNYHRRHTESVIGQTLSEKKIEDFFREFYTVQRFIFRNYELNGGFHEKWEQYLRKQWNDFFPGRTFEELSEFYPLDMMREKIPGNR